MTFWAIGIHDNKIYMVADVRVSKSTELGYGETRAYADTAAKLLFKSYIDQNSNDVSLGICMAGKPYVGGFEFSDVAEKFIKGLVEPGVPINNAQDAMKKLLKYCFQLEPKFDPTKVILGIGVVTNNQPSLASSASYLNPGNYVDMYFCQNDIKYKTNCSSFLNSAAVEPAYQLQYPIPVERLKEIVFTDRHSGRRQAVSPESDHVILGKEGIIDFCLHSKAPLSETQYIQSLQAGHDITNAIVPSQPNPLLDPSRMQVSTRLLPSGGFFSMSNVNASPPQNDVLDVQREESENISGRHYLPGMGRGGEDS